MKTKMFWTFSSVKMGENSSKKPSYLSEDNLKLSFSNSEWENATKLLQVKWWWPAALPAWDALQLLCWDPAPRHRIIAENCKIWRIITKMQTQKWLTITTKKQTWGNVRPSPKLEKTGKQKLHHSSPNTWKITQISKSRTTKNAIFTSARFPLLPKLKPSLSGPRRNTGALHIP